MKKSQKYILMYKNDEVLSFEVNFEEPSIKILERKDHFDEAPYGVNSVEDSLHLYRFFNSRTIAPPRWDSKLILKATKCWSLFELSFKGHGLSLANHYWYKKEDENLRYEDINFFTNKWDDSFARAILRGDYDALKNCSLNVPDIVTPGWAIKGWLYDNGPKLYKIGIVKDQYEDCLGEVLGYKLASKIFNEDEVLKYELKKINGKYASMSKAMIGVDEELVPVSFVLPRRLYDLYFIKNNNKNINKTFYEEMEKFGMPELYEFFIKLAVLRSIGFISDLHFNNISIIRNIKTKKIRVAPLYDLAGAFGTCKSARELVKKGEKGTYIIVYYLFNNLEPDWDYSWYDPNKLIGFEDTIREILSKSSFYTPEILDRIVNVYLQQKSSLDELATRK